MSLKHSPSFFRQSEDPVLQKCNKNSSFNTENRIRILTTNIRVKMAVKTGNRCLVKNIIKIIIEIFDKILPIPSGI